MDFLLFALAAITFALLLALCKGISLDRCLKDFADFPVVIVRKENAFQGTMLLRSSGIELTFDAQQDERKGYLLYADEYPSLVAVVRYHDALSKEQFARRQRAMKAIYYPSWFSSAKRFFSSVFKIARDGFLEIINLIVGQAKSLSRWGDIISREERQTKAIGMELLDVLGPAYDGILERHLGHRVAVELQTEKGIQSVKGILKDYTAQFIELMDADYCFEKDKERRKADVILLRSRALPRFILR